MHPGADDRELAIADAITQLRAISSYDAALRQRVEGVLWMVLGLVVACLFLGYAKAYGDDWPVGVLAVFWVPFVGAGLAVVWGMRRGLALDNVAPHVRSGWAFGALGVASVAAVVAIVVAGSESAPGVALLAISASAALPALWRELGYSTLGRRVGLVVAAVGVAFALGAAATGAGADAFTWAGVAAGLAFVAGGVYQTLQG